MIHNQHSHTNGFECHDIHSFGARMWMNMPIVWRYCIYTVVCSRSTKNRSFQWVCVGQLLAYASSNSINMVRSFWGQNSCCCCCCCCYISDHQTRLQILWMIKRIDLIHNVINFILTWRFDLLNSSSNNTACFQFFFSLHSHFTLTFHRWNFNWTIMSTKLSTKWNCIKCLLL